MGIGDCAITSAQMPKSAGFSGVPGPGEMTTLSNSPRTSTENPAQSLGTSVGAQPLTSASRWNRLSVNESALSMSNVRSGSLTADAPDSVISPKYEPTGLIRHP